MVRVRVIGVAGISYALYSMVQPLVIMLHLDSVECIVGLEMSQISD